MIYPSFYSHFVVKYLSRECSYLSMVQWKTKGLDYHMCIYVYVSNKRIGTMFWYFINRILHSLWPYTITSCNQHLYQGVGRTSGSDFAFGKWRQGRVGRESHTSRQLTNLCAECAYEFVVGSLEWDTSGRLPQLLVINKRFSRVGY